MFAPLVDFFTGRSSAWKAKYNAAFVTLVNPDTGEPYTASGGSGSSGSITAAGVNGTLAQAVQGITGGVPVPVSAAALPLPTGAATETTLAALNTKIPALESGRVPVDGSGVTQPIAAAALPLPTGAASETTLAALNTKIPNQGIPGLLPVDTLGTPGASRVQVTAGIAASVTLTTTCRRVSMFATQGTWYSISGTATATSHYIGAGERLDFDVPASTTISVLRETTDGSIRITELV